MTSDTKFTTEQKIAALRHLSGGKGLDAVALIMHCGRSDVLELVSGHGYPDADKMLWAADVLTKNAESDRAPVAHPEAARISRATPPRTAPGSALARAVPQSDEIHTLISAAQQHSSKRIQTAGAKVADAVARLRKLIQEDQERNAEKRAAEVARTEAKAEVERLEKRLAAAKAKLRSTGNTSKTATSHNLSPEELERRRQQLDQVRARNQKILDDHGVSTKDVRAWAADADVECPNTGALPRRVLEAFDAAHRSEGSA